MARYRIAPHDLMNDIWMIEGKTGLFGGWFNHGFGSYKEVSEMCSILNGDRIKDIKANQNRIVSVQK